MNRRGFLGSLVALVAAPKAVTAKQMEHVTVGYVAPVGPQTWTTVSDPVLTTYPYRLIGHTITITTAHTAGFLPTVIMK